MPNKASAKKELRKAKKRADWNRGRKKVLREAIKETTKSEKFEDAVKSVQKAQKALDKAAKRGVIKKNTASRKLSRLMKKVNKMKLVKVEA